jgi:hypothetical protein
MLEQGKNNPLAVPSSNTVSDSYLQARGRQKGGARSYGPALHQKCMDIPLTHTMTACMIKTMMKLVACVPKPRSTNTWYKMLSTSLLLAYWHAACCNTSFCLLALLCGGI